MRRCKLWAADSHESFLWVCFFCGEMLREGAGV